MGSWYEDKKREAENKIKRWERRYNDDKEKIRMFVRDAYLDTRSPGRIAAYLRWLAENGVDDNGGA